MPFGREPRRKATRKYSTLASRRMPPFTDSIFQGGRKSVARSPCPPRGRVPSAAPSLRSRPRPTSFTRGLWSPRLTRSPRPRIGITRWPSFRPTNKTVPSPASLTGVRGFSSPRSVPTTSRAIARAGALGRHRYTATNTRTPSSLLSSTPASSTSMTSASSLMPRS